MAAHDLQETVERAIVKQRKGIGLTTAIVAVLLAVASMLGNGANTKKIVIETKTADWWAYVHSSDTNARIYTASARLAQMNRDGGAVQDFTQLAKEQMKISDDARVTAQGLENYSALQNRIGHFCSLAELCLQISIVVCSVSLLTDLLLFWHLSFISSGAGVVLIILAWMQH